MRESWNGSTRTSRGLPCSSAVSIDSIDHKSSCDPRSSRNLIQSIRSLKFHMGSSESTLSNTGQPLIVAAAIGKSLETLLGPTGAMKMVHTGQSGRESDIVVSSSPTVLLRAMEVLHPCGSLILQTLEGMEEAYGSGSTSLIALCGALSAACYSIQEQGVPVNSILDGLRVAEDLCIDVLRDLSFPTKDALQEVGALKTLHGLSCRLDGLKKNHRDQQQYTSQGGKTSRILTGLAAGLQHSIQPEGSVPQGLSLPAALATDVLSALGFETNVFGDENTVVVDPATELARVRTRLLVGPDSTSSFVVPRAAIVNIAPGERAAVEEAFANRCTSCTKLPEVRKSTISQSRATVTICIRGVAIVLGDLSAAAGASNAAISQIPITGILRNADMLLNRSAAGNNNRWAENVSSTLQHFGVDVLLVTGEVCAKLRQSLALKGIAVLSGCLQEEVEATRSASGATPVQTIEVLTSGDIGRGREFQREERQRGSARDQCGGLLASLLDAGVVSEERCVFVPELGTQRGPGLGNSDTLFLLHDQELDDIDIPNTRSRIGSTNAKPWTEGEEETRRQADIVVMCCGTTLSVCEELRHKFWRVVRRVAGALTEGIVLPGAGASEVACATNLELEAQRLETENAGRLGHPTSMTQLYTPLVLRAMAGALDEVLLLCMANAGGASPDAPQRLSAAKKAAVKHLVRRQRQTVTTSSRLLKGSDCTGFNPCPMWGLVPELAVISVAAIDGESSVEGALVGLGDEWDGNSLQGSLDSLPLEGYCQQRRSFVLDNYGSKIGCIERAVGLVSLLTGTDGTLLAPA